MRKEIENNCELYILQEPMKTLICAIKFLYSVGNSSLKTLSLKNFEWVWNKKMEF